MSKKYVLHLQSTETYGEACVTWIFQCLKFISKGAGTFHSAGQSKAPIAQMADIGFKVVLLEQLNQKWKQKHF